MSAIATSPDEPDPDELRRALAAASGMEFLPVLPAPPPEALRLLPRSIAVRFSAASVAAEPDESELCVAVSDPLSFDLLDGLRFSLRRDLRLVVAPPAEIQRIITDFYLQSA